MAPTAHPFAREARRVHDIAGLTEADIARATGAAPSTARAWLAGTRKPTGERADRLIELSALVERLQRVMAGSYISVWLRRLYVLPARTGKTSIPLSRIVVASVRPPGTNRAP
jgi:transcriptional regulator with XRE-family HTH domain